MGLTVKQRLDQHDKQVAAIRNLIHEGMRLMIETRKELRALTADHRKTEQSLKALIDTMRDGANGDDLELRVPDGTVVLDEDGRLLADLVGDGTRFEAAANAR